MKLVQHLFFRHIVLVNYTLSKLCDGSIKKGGILTYCCYKSPSPLLLKIKSTSLSIISYVMDELTPYSPFRCLCISQFLLGSRPIKRLR